MLDGLTNGLLLPDLLITNFRGVERLSIGRLGRVTLLVGRNGIGKTTVLEAVRVYAARAHPSVLRELLGKREELSTVLDEDGAPITSPNLSALFYGRKLTRDRSITIGPRTGTDVVRLDVSGHVSMPGPQQHLPFDIPREDEVRAVNVMHHGRHRILPWLTDRGAVHANPWREPYRKYRQHSLFGEWEWPSIECKALGPGLPDNAMLARFWDRVALTGAEELSLQALRLAFEGIERVALVGDDRRGYGRPDRRVIVKLKEYPNPVPLRSLGDGVTRLLAAGLALANSSGGFVLIDEVENGLHFTVQSTFWSMILKAARQHDVQVIATTHSWDCVRGFARAVAQSHHGDAALVRISRSGNQVRAVEYTEEDLEIAAAQDIEVR